MILMATLPKYHLIDATQFKQDATYLTLQNLNSNSHGVYVEFSTAYNRDSYNLVCDVSFAISETGEQKTVKFDLIVSGKKGRIFIPFILSANFPYTVVDGVAARMKNPIFKVVEGNLVAFSINTYTYINVSKVRLKRLTPQELRAGLETDVYITYYKNNNA